MKLKTFITICTNVRKHAQIERKKINKNTFQIEYCLDREFGAFSVRLQKLPGTDTEWRQCSKPVQQERYLGRCWTPGNRWRGN